MATLVEIAEYLGGSVTSVSRVLNQPSRQYTNCLSETQSFKTFIRHVYGKRNCGILHLVWATIDGESRQVLCDYLKPDGGYALKYPK